jgi:hypothetical protein
MGEDAPSAVELAALYNRRWSIEESFDEFKTHLADRKVILRSKKPELVKQEFYALLLTHAARVPLIYRLFMLCEFFSAGCPRLAPFPPKRRQEWFDSVLREMATHRAVTSRGKRNIRGVKKRTSNYGVRKRGDPINQPCDPIPRILSI